MHIGVVMVAPYIRYTPLFISVNFVIFSIFTRLSSVEFFKVNAIFMVLGIMYNDDRHFI